jgi:hypothetical protein
MEDCLNIILRKFYFLFLIGDKLNNAFFKVLVCYLLLWLEMICKIGYKSVFLSISVKTTNLFVHLLNFY